MSGLRERILKGIKSGVATATSTVGVRNATPIFKRIARLVVTGALILPIAACVTTRGYGDGYGGKSVVGAILGGAGGGVIGSQFGKGNGKIATTILGTILGAYVGAGVGASLDRADRMYMQRAEQNAHRAAIGETITWQNPQNGNWGEITPVRQGRGHYGEYCREYQTTVYIGGRAQTAYGTMCRDRGGDWRLMSSLEDAPQTHLFASIDESVLDDNRPVIG